MPTRTHGDDPDLLPFVTTVKDVLSNLYNSDGTLPNMNEETTTLQPGERGVVRFDSDSLAPAIRAGFVIMNRTDVSLLKRLHVSSLSPLVINFAGTLEVSTTR